MMAVFSRACGRRGGVARHGKRPFSWTLDSCRGVVFASLELYIYLVGQFSPIYEIHIGVALRIMPPRRLLL